LSRGTNWRHSPAPASRPQERALFLRSQRERSLYCRIALIGR
jgi:hypothetical protein